MPRRWRVAFAPNYRTNWTRTSSAWCSTWRAMRLGMNRASEGGRFALLDSAETHKPSRVGPSRAGYSSFTREPVSPHKETARPYEISGSPCEETARPHEGTARLHEEIARPYEGIARPREETARPHEEMEFPHKGIVSPHEEKTRSHAHQPIAGGFLGPAQMRSRRIRIALRIVIAVVARSALPVLLAIARRKEVRFDVLHRP